MRAISMAVLWLAGSSVLTAAGAQQPPAAVCKFDHRTVELRRVTSGPSAFNFDPVSALHRQPYFATGETVWMSKEQQGWSCATITRETAKGWVTESGWISSSRLERVESAKAGPVK